MSQSNEATRRLQMEMAIEQASRDFDLTMKFHVEAAKTARSYFIALVDEGFTEGQAIEIIKSHGINPKTS